MKAAKISGGQKRLRISDAIAKLIAGMLDRIREALVNLLQRAEQRCSQAQKKLLFFAFCILFGGYCLYLLFGSAGSSVSSFALRRDNGSPPLALPPPKADKTAGGR